jgi:predicted  nucleic acid-binding Zn-ribbon protein
MGCFITLPTSSTPETHDTLTLCESCGRILYWR